MNIRNALYVSLGWFSLGAGTLGIFLPVLPTVPLWLLAAWAFAKSSPRLHNWLINHKRFGPVIVTWQQKGGIPRRIKIRAIITIWLSLIFSMWLIGETWAYGMLCTSGLLVSCYLWTRPEPESEN